MDELDRDRRADQAFFSRAGIERGAAPRRGGSRGIGGRDGREKIGAGGLGGEHDEQRTQPLATGHDRRVGVLGERSTRGRRHTLQLQLDASHPLEQPLAAAVDQRLDSICVSGGLGDGRLSAAGSPTAVLTPSPGHRAEVDHDDAAGGEQIADLAQACPLQLRRQARRAQGSA